VTASAHDVRQYAACLGLGGAGAALVLVALRQTWAHVVTTAPAPLPHGSLPVSGQDLVPVAGALALVSLAALAAVIATRGFARRVVGVVLALSGVAIVVLVSAHLGTAGVLAAAAHAGSATQAGSVTAGGGSPLSSGPVPGGSVTGISVPGHVAMVSLPWRGLAVLGALAVLAAGSLAVWRGARWPAMSSRYDRPGGPQPPAGTDTATLWESLSSGVDPTEASGPHR
jgi:uncharacterized membrane protein (TIGR02234 family)